VIAYVGSFFNREGIGQIAKQAMIGVFNTVVYFAVLNILISLSVPLFWRVTTSFAVATETSYLLNRRWTFRLKGGIGPWRETAVFFVVNGVAWVATLAIVFGADAAFGPLSRLGENLANLVAGCLLLLPKLALYRDLVFRGSLTSGSPSGPGPGDGAEPEPNGVPPHLPERPDGDAAG